MWNNLYFCENRLISGLTFIMFMVIIFFVSSAYLFNLTFKKIATRLDTFLNFNKIELCFYFASLNTLLTLYNSIEAYVWSHAIVTRLKDRTKALSKSSKAKFETVGRRKIIPSLCFKLFLTLPARCISESSVKTKINLNFISALLCGISKGFSQKDLKGLRKTFWSTTKKCENKNQQNRALLFLRRFNHPSQCNNVIEAYVWSHVSSSEIGDWYGKDWLPNQHLRTQS